MSEEPQVWPVPVEQIEAAVNEWQAADPEVAKRRGWSDAEALEETFLNHGIQLVPLADDPTEYVVEVDGRPVGRSGSKFAGAEFTGPFAANDALGIWLNVNNEHIDSDPFPRIVMRTATAEELDAANAREREILHRDLGSPPF